MNKKIFTHLIYTLACVFTLTACNASLTISDKLTSEQRKLWREALDFPAHCEDGKYEWLDNADMPYIYFKPLTSGNTLVYNVCERYSYQDEVNVFLYKGGNSQPEIIKFPVYDHIEGADIYKDKHDKKLAIPKGTFTSSLSERLLKRGIEVLDNGYISVTRHYNGPGSCGTLTTYDISQSVAQVVELRARVDCEGGEGDMNKWPVYSLD